MTCPDCGHQNLAGADHCDHCGVALSAAGLAPPKGRLQRAIAETPLKDLQPAAALTVGPREGVAKVIRLMRDNRQGSVLVVDAGKLLGIFTERDIVNRLAVGARDLETLPITEVMTRDPKALREDDTVAFALHRMAIGNYRHVPIVQEGKPMRFVSVRGLLRYLNERAG